MDRYIHKNLFLKLLLKLVVQLPKLNYSLKYLEQLSGKLRKAGIIESHRGPFGGQTLAKKPEEISIGDIVRVLEESTAITDCAEQEKQVCGVCNKAGECLSRWVWIEASKAKRQAGEKSGAATEKTDH